MGTTNGKVPGRVKYTFAFGALGKDLIYGMMATFAMIYFTDVLKVSPGFVGIVFFVAKLWDAFNDLFMGMIVDNTRSRFGKFVPWLVIGTLVNSVVFVVLFTDFKLTGTSLCIFVAVIYVLWGMTYTIMDIPYWSVIPNLTSDPHEREVVSVLPRIFASIGQSLVIAGFGVQIIAALGGGYIGYHRFAMIIAGTFILTIGVAVCNLKVKENNAPSEKISFKDVFSIIKRNDQLQSAVGLILLYNVGIQFIMGVAVYYFTYVCGNANMLSAFMISASIAEVVGLIIFPEVAKKLSRHTSFLLACILPFIGLALLLVVGFVCPQNIVLTAISGVIVKTGTGLELGCATVFLSDVVDYGEYKLEKEIMHTITITLIAVLFLSLITWKLSKLISQSISYPVRQLCEMTKEVAQGNFDVHGPQNTTEELQILTNNFEHMAQKVERLIEDVKVEQQNLRKKELQLLQEQINPHFLYNTLDTIMWLAIDHQDDKVVEMVAALSGFFRTSLSHGEDKITIREELEHVENYLKIQQLRYGDIMEYSIDVPDEIKKNDIVKITLQPLVENALYHGLKKQREKGMIKISSVDDENNIFLIVEDNGVGMQPEQVVQINKEMYEDIWVNRTTGFGIANVNRRIKLYYGEEYGLILESEPDIGTKVIVVVPKTRQAEKK